MRVLLACALATSLNPITRVAQLLEGLSKKVEADGKAEQDLYDKYKCWCTKVINSKSSSMEANNLRISELAAYIDDLSNGRVELTGERAQLEKEIKELEKAIADAEAMREKEHEDYLAAKDEMDKAIAALTSAVSTMAAGAPVGLAGVSSELKHVMEVGSGFLSKADVDGLTGALAAQTPDVDWNKLNREATFKQNYTSRSGKIQDILSDMLQTFTDNRAEAVTAETDAASSHTSLMTAKNAQLGASKQALLDKAGENGARAESLAESEAEKTNLEEQNTRDTTFLADTKTACQTKATEWAERKRLRTGEVAALSQALGVLRSDDARDLFKRSFDNDSFLQLGRKVHGSRGSRALAMIRRTASISQDARLSALATVLSTRSDAALGRNETDVAADPFATVISAVDAMLTSLADEEQEDLQKKDQCESDRMTNTQEAKMTSKEIDTNTETIDRLTAAIEAANKQIADINDQMLDLSNEKRAANEQRAAEMTEYGINQQDDTAAAGLVETAMGVLTDFYANENLALVQKAKQEPFVAAGEAPTPPPSTWGDGGGYGGATGEKNGIIAIMALIKQDIEKDMATATTNENTAASEHAALTADIDATVSSLQTSKGELEGKVATDESSMGTEKGERTTNQGSLTSTLAFLKSIAPGCDFIAVNFDIRLKNRQAEMDGLQKAKAILQGASFE